MRIRCCIIRLRTHSFHVTRCKKTPMDAECAAIVLQAVARGRAARWRMRSPFFRAAARAGWLRSHAVQESIFTATSSFI